MRIRAYTSPRVADYGSDAFWRATRAMSPVVRSMLDVLPEFSRRDVWMIRGAVPWRRPRGAPPWQTKLYVCVRARHYWRTIARLFVAFRGEPIRWKFCFADREAFARPDKIIFYPESTAELRALVPRLRRLVSDCTFHGLSHAASTGHAGLERRGTEGLFVGCDPHFLQVSWRAYHALCEPWLGLNRAWVAGQSGGIARWREIMNLSASHGGPATLEPDPAHVRRVRRFWKLIAPDAFREEQR